MTSVPTGKLPSASPSTVTATPSSSVVALSGAPRSGTCPTLDEISEALDLPAWTIQRRLAEGGIAYKELVEETRKELALSYLKQPHLPLTEIAFLLGYSELSAFSRAFHRWTGVAPRRYRASVRT